MNKQRTLTLAALFLTAALSLSAQLTTTTKTTKVAPGETETTVITRENPAPATKRTVKKPVKKSTTPARHAAHPVESATERQLKELQARQAAQQAEIDALNQQSAAKDAALAAAQSAAATAQSQAATANAQAAAATAAAQSQADTVTSLKSTVTDLQNSQVGLAGTISTTKTELNEKIDSPTTIHYKGVTITPVAFFAFENVWRQRSVNSDINTPFNNIPYMSANEAHTTELNFSGRQSRIGALLTGDAGKFKLSGYFESDFLGAGTTSNGNQSNSFVLRQRQIWGQVATTSGFTLTGGQMWSLVTETGKSTDNRTEKLPNTIDAQYLVGYNWARQPAVRLQQKFTSGTNALTIAMSLEQAQITGFSAVNAPTNFFFNGAGQNGGLFNAYNGTPTNNIAPDVFIKSTLDTAKSHFEIGGVARFFRDRIYPGAATANTIPGSVANATLQPYNDTKFGGGVFGSGRVSVAKQLDLALQVMAGDGVGRYGSSQLADATVHPNGTLEPLRNYHGLVSIETHPTPKLDVYAYVGSEYVQRTQYLTGVTATPYTGYGTINSVLTGCNVEPNLTTGGNGAGGSITPTSGTCAASTRVIIEGMAGFTYRIVSSPKFGRLQYQVNYQYLTKSAWTGVSSGTYGSANANFGSPKAVDNMVFTGLRYYIP
jgi:hypothetical protein